MKTIVQWIMVIGLAFLLSSCAANRNGDTPVPAGTAIDNPNQETVPVDPAVDLDSKPPLATVTINGTSQTAGLGTYCWSDPAKGLGICLDAIGIPTGQEPLVVEPTFTAQFSIPVEEEPREVVATVRPVSPESEMSTEVDGLRWWEYAEGETFELPNSRMPSLDLELEPGLYVLDLFVSWESLGDAVYGFLIEVR